MMLVLVTALAWASAVGEAMADRQEPVGENLVVGGDFEAQTQGWRTTKGREIVELDDAPSPTHALMLDCKEAQYYFAIAGPDVPIEARTLYRLRATVKRTSGAGYLRIGGGYQDADHKGLKRGDWGLHAYPIALTPGQGAGQWITYEGTFICNRDEVAYLAFRVIIKNGADTVYVDDVSIFKLERPPVPRLHFPDDVTWPGSPGRMGMKLESIEHTDRGLTAITTGARYELDAEARTLVCYQRIPQERKVVTFSFDPPLAPLRMPPKILTRMEPIFYDEDWGALVGEDVGLSINGDSLIVLGTNKPLTITATSHIAPRHYRLFNQNLLAIDEQGGFCLYPEIRLEYEAEPSRFTGEPEDTSEPGWQATLQVGPCQRVALGVFPPKSFPWEQSFRDRIVHSNRYPADEAIRSWSQRCNILVLHQNIYEGGSSRGPYVTEDEGEFRRVISTAHECGMQVAPYFNPGAYHDQDADHMLDLILDFRERYGFDGCYFDGLYRGDQWIKSYIFIRTVRLFLGDKVIYTHCTLNPPANATSIYCPFIDAYSDFILRGEGQTIGGPDDPYLRYVVGTYNISNSIATLKGDKMQDATEQEKLQAMLDLHGRARWPYPGKEERDRLFLEWYFPTIDGLYQQWQAQQR